MIPYRVLVSNMDILYSDLKRKDTETLSSRYVSTLLVNHIDIIEMTT